MTNDRTGLVSVIGYALRRAAYLLPVVALVTVRALTYASPPEIRSTGWYDGAEQKGRGHLSLTGIPSERPAPGGGPQAVDPGLLPALAGGVRLFAPLFGAGLLALASLTQQDGASAEPQPRAPPLS